jgi:hypothetical protein
LRYGARAFQASGERRDRSAESLALHVASRDTEGKPRVALSMRLRPRRWSASLSGERRYRTGRAHDLEQWGGEQQLEARVRRIEPAGFTKISALGLSRTAPG